MVDPESLSIALDAAREARLSPGRVVLFDTKGISEETYRNHETVGSLVEFGLRNKISYSERILASGEGKTKLAFLSFSSGTTGRPKVSDFLFALSWRENHANPFHDRQLLSLTSR